ncbi:putative oxidoreductase [Podospora australis]|uniref:Oxidoreductase n=1 Tax=Podospora australis TaxID=1536484 RepID=A0AAN6WRQ2_9PEZI|nr:putative oxidoreductase [Podospora australis]
MRMVQIRKSISIYQYITYLNFPLTNPIPNITMAVWLITGCSSGFGLELAKVAASRGDKVLAASRNPANIQLSHQNIKLVRLNHNAPLENIKTVVDDLVQVFGTIDIVVNNAGYVQTGTLEESTPEETFNQFQANVFGPLNLYRAVLPHLRAKKSGTLVTMGSMAAWYPMNSCNLYNMSKAALRWAGIGLAEEVKQFGIKHTLVEPGFFRTSLLKPGANLSGTPAKTRIPEYDELNTTADEAFKNFHGGQLGDPVKGAKIIYEVVTGTGVAAGKELPGFFPVGSDATEEIGKALDKTREDVEAWRDISKLTDFKE